jgi:cysteine desulfurase / selenocysteine lyase
MNWNDVRNEFPVCRKYIYLNPAGGSPLSTSAAKEGLRFYNEMHEFGDTLYDQWMIQAAGVRKKLADFIGADPEEIAFTSNTSHGMNLVSHALKDRGDVITMKHEFPSSTLPWLNQGVNLKMVEPDGVYYPIRRIEDAIESKTKILVSSYIQYSTGFRQDLEALGKLCKKHNLIFVVNATQAMGIFPIDVSRCSIDFLVFSGLKWATAGYGAGGLFISKKWLSEIKMPFAGWQSVDQPGLMDNTQSKLRSEASVLEGGCPSFPTVFALGGAISLFNRIGTQKVMKRVLELSGYLTQKLIDLKLPVASPQEDEYRSGIVIIKTRNAAGIVKLLAEKKIIVSARGEGLRVSVSIFTNREDIDTFIKAASQISNQF